jgi:hypothetical protein
MTCTRPVADDPEPCRPTHPFDFALLDLQECGILRLHVEDFLIGQDIGSVVLN